MALRNGGFASQARARPPDPKVLDPPGDRSSSSTLDLALTAFQCQFVSAQGHAEVGLRPAVESGSEASGCPLQAPHPQAPLHHPLWPRQQPFLLWASAGLGPAPRTRPQRLLSVSS